LEDLLPFHFTDSSIEDGSVVSQGILEYVIPFVDVDEGTIRVTEEWYEKTMLLALDEGDRTTPTERELITQEEDKGGTEPGEVSTIRSRRTRKHVQDSNFVFI